MTATTDVNLTEMADTRQWPEMHYLFVERVGNIPENAPLAWNEMHRLIPEIEAQNRVTGYMSLYRMDQNVYRAGVSVAAKPARLPEGVRYEKYAGGTFHRFVLTGPFRQLPEATGLAFARVREQQLPLRADFNIEYYVKDPRVTPEDELITEILFPASDEAAVRAVIAGMARARYEKDAAASVAPYAADVVSYTLAPPLAHHGVDAAGLQAWFDSWDGPITIEPRDFEVTVAGDTAVAYGFMRMEGTKINPPAKPNFWMRETLVLERRGGAWTIVHEHTSVPFYMDASTRPAFDLEP